jgi:MFS superfamily sulfate permease-like transporter
MESLRKENFMSNLKYDLPASLVVFLVALPLCLGIALASGAPLFSGIIAGIVGGIVVGFMSGSSLGVSGPAAGLAVIVLSSIQELGSFEIFLFAVVIAGALQLLLGILKAGVIGYYFPSAVIKGMLSGIGIIIVLKQIPHAFGYDKDPEGDFEFFQMDGHNTFSDLGYMFDYITPGVVAVTVISMAILLLWERPFIKKNKILAMIPGPLLAVMAGIVLNKIFSGNSTFNITKDHLVNIPVSDSIAGFVGQFSIPDFTQWNNPQVYIIALTIAVVASLETLLSVEASDKLDPHKNVTPTNRELIAQGTGNMISGLIGGLPVTQVIVRSSANIQSGGRSKVSAIFHGILLLVSAMVLPSLINQVPLASLAAVLFMVGYKLAKPSVFFDMYKKGLSQFTPFVATVLGIIFTDLLMGIGLGMAVAIFHILWNNYKTPYHFDPNTYEKGKPVRIQLSEEVTFLNKGGILHTLNMLPKEAHVIIDLSKNKYIHPDVIEIIEDFTENAKTRNIVVELVGELKEVNVNPVHEFGKTVM